MDSKDIKKINDIFSKQAYGIPIVFKSDDFKKEISVLLSSYIRDLESHGVSSDIVGRIKRFKRSCMFTISNYLCGSHSNAFLNFERAIESLGIMDSELFYSVLDEMILFRARENKVDVDYTIDQMYHIPLNRRGVVATQRYSFPGLPCLYLCSSIYTCWVELNRPSLNRFQVATIKVNRDKQINVLNLTNIPQRLEELKGNIEFKTEDYFLYWPVLALCSVKVNHEEDPFKPEYIFPQFLLEYIIKRKNNIQGIKYISIKSAAICDKQLNADCHTYVSYVFPSRSRNMHDIKCSELEGMFKIQYNRSGRELQVLARLLSFDHARLRLILSTGDKYETVKKQLMQRTLYTSDGMAYPYFSSEFGMSELAMLRDEFDDIKDFQTSFVIEDSIDKDPSS